MFYISGALGMCCQPIRIMIQEMDLREVTRERIHDNEKEWEIVNRHSDLSLTIICRLVQEQRFHADILWVAGTMLNMPC